MPKTSKSQLEAVKKHDSTHFKYQSVKLKISEYEKLKKAVEISKEPMNGFLRSAIMERVSKYVPVEPAQNGTGSGEMDEPN